MANLYEKLSDNTKNTVNISNMRAAYLTQPAILKDEDIIKQPIKLFKEWFEKACNCNLIEEPNAMCLATTTKNGLPSARYVLLKHFDEMGFTFFTNYSSRKGREMNENPNVAAVFYWEPLRRSIRIEGKASKISEDESTAYFHSRPKDSQIGACVSKQSSTIPNRKVLDDENTSLKKLYENNEVPRPPDWGGILIIPTRIEFWQGQSNRLHDRFLFRRPNENEKPDEILVHSAEDGWIYERLSP